MKKGLLSLVVLKMLVMAVFFVQGESGVVIENRSNATAITVSVYHGNETIVLLVGFLDAGSVIDWDFKTIAANFSRPLAAGPVPAEHLFVIRNLDSNSTITSQYFYDGTNVTILDDPMGGLSIKARGSRSD